METARTAFTLSTTLVPAVRLSVSLPLLVPLRSVARGIRPYMTAFYDPMITSLCSDGCEVRLPAGAWRDG